MFTQSDGFFFSYTLSRNQAVIVEYTHDAGSDLFQIGRSSESPIDFVVMDTVPGNRSVDKVSSQSTISRFACRIITDREGLQASIYAAGFDSSRNIFLGETIFPFPHFACTNLTFF